MSGEAKRAYRRRLCYICAKEKYGSNASGIIPICENCRDIWDIKETETRTTESRPTPPLAPRYIDFAADLDALAGNTG